MLEGSVGWGEGKDTLELWLNLLLLHPPLEAPTLHSFIHYSFIQLKYIGYLPRDRHMPGCQL